MARFSVLLICIVCTGYLPLRSVASGMADFLDKQLATNQFIMVNHFGNTLGYDNLTDNYYTEFKRKSGRNIDLVNAHYARRHFTGGRIVKREESSTTGNQADGPEYSFVVAQKCFSDWATMNDRWDLKVNCMGHQFIGLYHGSDPFITNRMRSYMIRWIGNAIKEYLLVLDETLGPLRDHLEIVQIELKNVIRFIIRRLRRKIEYLWDDLDYFDAHETPEIHEELSGGSIVVVSEFYIVVINMGEGRVFACDDSGAIWDLTSEHQHRNLSWFINGKQSLGAPFIHIQPKNFKGQDGADRKMKFVLLVSANIAHLMSQEELSQIIWSQMSKGLGSEQQLLFAATASSVIQMVTDKLNNTEVDGSELDHSIVIVGLDRLENHAN